MIRSAAAMMALLVCGVTTAAEFHVPSFSYPTIQAAVDAASDGDEILVAPGTYTGTGNEVVHMGGRAITLRATGTPGETILDGEDARGVVRCGDNAGADTIIEGFTITGGSSASYYGILCTYGSSPTITDCTISDNNCTGINCNYSGNPTITGCTISGNSGTGISCGEVSAPTISGCTISGNSSNGIYCGNSSPTISGCTISGNSGGGIACWDSSPTITDCTITNNTATNGGGIYFHGEYSSPTITNCTITGNTASATYLGGGGICCWGSSPTITGCTFSNNTATNGGGIYCWYGSDPTITDCTITNNTANSNGGGIYCIYSSPTISNSTACGNSPDQIDGDYTDNGGNTVSDECPICPDTNSDAVVDSDDVFAVVAAWGSDDPDADVDSDGLVSIFDLLTVLAMWGPCE